MMACSTVRDPKLYKQKKVVCQFDAPRLKVLHLSGTHIDTQTHSHTHIGIRSNLLDGNNTTNILTVKMKNSPT